MGPGMIYGMILYSIVIYFVYAVLKALSAKKIMFVFMAVVFLVAPILDAVIGGVALVNALSSYRYEGVFGSIQTKKCIVDSDVRVPYLSAWSECIKSDCIDEILFLEKGVPYGRKIIKRDENNVQTFKFVPASNYARDEYGCVVKTEIEIVGTTRLRSKEITRVSDGSMLAVCKDVQWTMASVPFFSWLFYDPAKVKTYRGDLRYECLEELVINPECPVSTPWWGAPGTIK